MWALHFSPLVKICPETFVNLEFPFAGILVYKLVRSMVTENVFLCLRPFSVFFMFPTFLFTLFIQNTPHKNLTFSVLFSYLFMFPVLYRVHKTFLSGDYILNSLYYTIIPRSFHPNFILSPTFLYIDTWTS